MLFIIRAGTPPTIEWVGTIPFTIALAAIIDLGLIVHFPIILTPHAIQTSSQITTGLATTGLYFIGIESSPQV